MRYLGILIGLLVLLSVPAVAQTATIQCFSDTARVPVWRIPDQQAVLEHVRCGQVVEVLSREGEEYYRVKVGNRIGYVEARYVNLQPAPQEQPRIVEHATPPRSPAAEIFGAYSLLSEDMNGAGARRYANGWQASVSGNFNSWFSLEWSAAGYYRRNSDIDTRDYFLQAGPKLNFGPVYVHALLGADRLSESGFSPSQSNIGFAGSFGGGLQLPASSRCGFRAGIDYVLSRHGGTIQNNIRILTGVVLRLGGKTSD